MAINKNFIVDAGLEVKASAVVNNNITVVGNANLGSVDTSSVNTSVANAGVLTVTGNATFSSVVTVQGNLVVQGTTTTVNSQTLNVGDNIITLNSDWPAGTAPSENAGVEINRGSSSNVSLIWNETSDRWQISSNTTTFGNIHSTLNDVVLGTDTSGNYVATISSANGVAGSGTGEGSAPTLYAVGANGITVTSSGINVAAGTELTSNSTGVHHNDIARTNTTTGNTSPNYAGTFTAVDSITTNARGHVTAVNTKTVTMPSSNNTTYTTSTVANTTTNQGLTRLTSSGNANTDTVIVGLDEITISSNSTAVYVDHNDITRTNTTDGNTSPNYAGTFTAVDSITTNARGHVTGVNTKTVTMPSSNNTTYTTSTVANTTTNQGIVRLTSSSNANTDTFIIGQDEVVVSSNSTAVYIDHGDVARTDGTSSTSPASGGTFTAVDSVTTNARGHVTAINVKTVTLPVDPNTTYDLAAVANTAANAGRLRLTSSSLANDDVIFVGTGTTTVSSNSTQITINSADQYVGTVTSVGGTGSVNGLTLSGTVTSSGNLTLGGSITAANTTTAGIVQLVDSVSNTSVTTAATPNSVKTAYDLANGKAATNQTMYIGTTAVTIDRASAALSLTGVNIDGSAGSATNATNSTKVLVTNSDTNATYRITIQQGTTGTNCDLLSTAGIYCNPSTDTLFATDFQIPSDIRLKTVVGSITDATNTISKLSTIKYKWNELSGKETSAVHIGVIAQEVEELIPELVTTNPETGYKTVSYNGLVPLLIESNKEMMSTIENLSSRVRELEEVISKLLRS